jgi:hypothetical protein
MTHARLLPILCGLMCLTSAAIAHGQAAPAADKPKVQYLSTDKVSRLADKPQGWSYNLKLSANLNVTGNQNVVGQVDGRSLLFGASILSSIGYLHEAHEWLNTMSLNESWSKTPTLDHVFKSNDLLDIQSIYNYFINDFTGPFARVQLQTGLFPTRRVTETGTTYVNEDDATDTRTSSMLLLSKPFQPLTINESVGWFVQPVHSERINAYGRAGFGGRHTFADGALSITDDGVTPITFTVLKDVHQAGAELFAGIDGKEVDGKVLYNLGASALFPLLSNDNTNRNILELTRVQMQGAVGMSVFSWMSINYQLKVIRDFQLVDAVQVQNALLLSFQYTLQSPEPKPAETPLPPEAEERIAELEGQVEAAEARAKAAEARATAAEGAPEAAPVPPATPAPAP